MSVDSVLAFILLLTVLYNTQRPDIVLAVGLTPSCKLASSRPTVDIIYVHACLWLLVHAIFMSQILRDGANFAQFGCEKMI